MPNSERIIVKPGDTIPEALLTMIQTACNACAEQRKSKRGPRSSKRSK